MSTQLRRTAAVLALAVAMAASVFCGSARADGNVSSPYFDCLPGYIYLQAPIATSPQGGFSNEIVYWIPLIYRWDGASWYAYQYGEYEWASLYGGSTNLGWYTLSGEAGGEQYAYGLPSGYYAVVNWVYFSSTGQWQSSYSINEHYINNTDGSLQGETWCSY